MTAEERVKQKYPDALARQDFFGTWSVFAAPYNCASLGDGLSSKAAWQSAAEQLGGSNE